MYGIPATKWFWFFLSFFWQGSTLQQLALIWWILPLLTASLRLLSSPPNEKTWMASQGPCFCLDGISFGFNIFIHSLLFPFIGQLILFIICPYLQAWQSNLHSGSADRWRNDPFPTPPSLTPLLPSFLSSSPNSNETWLTACCISSCHSNLPHPCDKCFFSIALSRPLSQYLSRSLHLRSLAVATTEKETGKENLKTREHLRQLVCFSSNLHPHSPPFLLLTHPPPPPTPPPLTMIYQLLWCTSFIHPGLSRAAGLYAQ